MQKNNYADVIYVIARKFGLNIYPISIYHCKILDLIQNHIGITPYFFENHRTARLGGVYFLLTIPPNQANNGKETLATITNKMGCGMDI
jgi:hypothetical protein